MSAAEKQVAQRMADVVPMSSTDAFIQQAIQANAPVETLERLFDLKLRHEASEARKAFYEAMQRFQRIKPDLPKTDSVSFGNGKTSYKFCPLSEIEKRLREPLDKCGLSFRFENLRDAESFGIKCIVSHVQGHSESTSMFAPPDGSGNKNAIQGIGSTSTYLQRYTLIAAFGLTTADEDDDGEATGDKPYTMLLLHNQTVRENYQVIAAIKDALAEEDYEQLAEYWCEMPDSVKSSIWVSTTKGGIFTPKEREAIKSDPAAKARQTYMERKHDSAQ